MIPISRRLKKHLAVVTDDNEYTKDMQKRVAYLDTITECMESPFGVILIQALENIEGSGLEALYSAMTKDGARTAKAEIKIARYLKAVLMGYVYEKQAFENAISQYIEMEQGASDAG